MAKKDEEKENIESEKISAAEIKQIQDQNKLFRDILQSMSNQSSNSYKRDEELDILDKTMDQVIRDEIDKVKKVGGDDITTFLYKTLNMKPGTGNNFIRGIEDLFAADKNEGMIQDFFNKKNKKNLIYEDLEVIVSYVHQLKEAVNVTRDSIVTADEIGKQISRNITFRNMSPESSEVKNALPLIEKMEEDLNLHHMVKNHIVVKTLEFGEYYVYTVPYKKLIQDYKNRHEGQNKPSSVLESVGHISPEKLSSFNKISKDSIPMSKLSKLMDTYLSSIEVSNESYTILDDMVNEEEIVSLENSDIVTQNTTLREFDKIVDNVLKNAEGKKKRTVKNTGSEAVIDNSTPSPKNKDGLWRGCYVKLIDPRRLVEVKILDKVIGYYYAVDLGPRPDGTAITKSIRMNIQNGVNERDLESEFVEKLASSIIQSMDKKYLQENSQFKELIINALLYDDLYTHKVKFQFISIDFITKFSIDEDINGDGQSMLINSLFYAKLYLYLLIFKVLSILSKSTDQKYYYIKSSGIDKEVSNQVQTVARSIKEGQLTFTDLMNYGTAINKIGKAKDVWVPVGSSGERAIETDILSGQDIPLNNDLMEKLITDAVNSTGVPSVITSYINEADYSRTLVMANAKFVGRVINYQLDFDRSLTELYKKLAKFHTDLDESVISSLEYHFSPPKSLNNVNMSDTLNNAEQVANFVVRTFMGENKSPTEEDNALKDKMFSKVIKDSLPMIDWAKMEEFYEDSQEEVKQMILDKESTPETDNF